MPDTNLKYGMTMQICNGSCKGRTLINDKCAGHNTSLDSMWSGITNLDLLWENLMYSLDKKITERE